LPSATNNGGTIEASPKSAHSTNSGGERWSRETIDMGWMHSFDADLGIKAKSINQNMWKLTDANFDFKLNEGVLTLNDVSAGLFGGRASMNGVIKSGAGAKDPISISVKLNANNVDAQGLMSAVTGKTSYTLTGTLSTVDVSVNATGSSPSALVQTLGGEGRINGKDIIVKGIDAAQLASAAKGSYKPLERAGSLFQSFQDGQTEFTDFNSEFLIQNGIVNFSKVYFDGPKATLNSTGNVNLPKWTVDFKNSMTVKDTDIPPFDFTIRGSLDNPLNSGGDIINNYFQKKIEKKATKFIEDKLGGKLNKLLGVPETNPEVNPEVPTVEPIDAGTAPQPQPQAQPNIKEEAAKEAVKALEGLFGR
jgi:AsmA protein